MNRRGSKRVDSALRMDKDGLDAPDITKKVVDEQYLAEKAAEEREREWQAMLNVSGVTTEMTEREVAVAIVGTAARLFDKGRRYPAPIKDDENFERLRTEVMFVFMDMVDDDINGDHPREFWQIRDTGLVGTKCNWVGHGECMMYMTGVISSKRSQRNA